jgi:hypothetical protein
MAPKSLAVLFAYVIHVVSCLDDLGADTQYRPTLLGLDPTNYPEKTANDVVETILEKTLDIFDDD